MGSGWLARVGADPRQRAREIGHAHTTFLSSRALSQISAGLRDVVAESWQRSADANVDPDADPPVTLTGADLEGYRAEHPLAVTIAVLRELLAGTAEDGRHLWAVSDTSGRLLWVEGHRSARNRAERMNFVEGALWDESHAGTNAPGTALAVDHEVQIFATEHFRHTVQAWTCAAAPIHDPVTGLIVGAIDVTGGDVVAHPHSLALVRAAARLAEAQLAEVRPPTAALAAGGLPTAGPDAAGLTTSPLDAAGLTATQLAEAGLAGTGLAPMRLAGTAPGTSPDHPQLWLPHPGPGPGAGGPPRFEALGRGEARLLAGGREIRLNRRHSEVVFLLASNPHGMTGEQLATALYEDYPSQTTLRVEMTRLRRVIGGLLQSRPYRLTVPVAADYADVRAALARGDVAAAVAGYDGPLLPSSEAPGVRAQRDWLDTQLRSAVIASGDPRVLQAWTERFGFDDLEPWERLAAVLPAGSAGLAATLARVRELRADYGLSG
jgi:hypothetical protein